MKRAIVLVLALLASCGGLKAGGNNPDAETGDDAGIPPDAPAACTTSITIDPDQPVLGDTITATGHWQNADTFAQPQWIVQYATADYPFTLLGSDGGVAQFTPNKVGVYHVHFEIAPASTCQDTDLDVTVAPVGANSTMWRLRVNPPPDSAAPPQERLVTVKGGTTNSVPQLSLDPGVAVASTVVDEHGAPVAAYLRFTPSGQPDEAVEAFSTVTGDFATRVQGAVAHDVLIVPASETLAPMRVTGWQALSPALQLAPADPIAGTVLAPDGQPLAGARVALAIGGVPTTIATSDANGDWSALGHAGGVVDVTVVPPDASGLPRLIATGTTIDPSLPIAIHYAASIATVDLVGVPVKSAGAAAPGALITFTGALASAGTITAGTKNVTAGGVIAATGRADGGGVLLHVVIARAPMTAVVEPVPAVDAVVAIDTSAGKPASIDAPAQVAITGTVVDPQGNARSGVRVRLTPIGALASGTLLVPATTTGAGGAFSIQAAPGGHYALAAIDLAQAYADVDVADVSGGDLGALSLGKALALTGTVQVGTSSGLAGAALTLLCATCTGVDASRAQGEAVTDGVGNFRLAVPDPGVGLR